MPPSNSSRIRLGLTSASAARVSPSFSRLSSALARIWSGSSSPTMQRSISFCDVKMMRRRTDFVLDDADVAFQIRERRQAFVERDQVADAVHRFELVLLHQLVGDGNAVDTLAALVQLAHAQEDAAVLFQAEIVGFEHAGHLDVERVVHQDRRPGRSAPRPDWQGVRVRARCQSSCSHKKPTVLQ